MPKQIFYRIKSYIRFQFKAHARGGYGIHSPFMFNFATRVLNEKLPYYAYDKVEKYRSSLLRDRSSINITDYGCGKSGIRRICDITSKSTKNSKEAQLLFRIALSNKSKNILELGTSVGLTTMYLAMTDSKSNITSLEGSSALAKVAKRTLQSNNINNVNIITGNIDETLKKAINSYETLDMVFFDANHKKKPTIKYFKNCLEKINKNTIFVFDDIHHSKEMEEAWNEIKSNKEVRVSVDIYSMGILFFNNELRCEEYTIRF